MLPIQTLTSYNFITIKSTQLNMDLIVFKLVIIRCFHKIPVVSLQDDQFSAFYEDEQIHWSVAIIAIQMDTQTRQVANLPNAIIRIVNWKMALFRIR